MESVWRNKYNSLEEYYEKEYDSKYYYISDDQKTIDPDETLQEINDYDVDTQCEEYKKCAVNFFYFAHKYVKIVHPTRGPIPFICYQYQKRVIDNYNKHRFNIICKFRQGGLTTLTEIWCMWRCMFKEDQQILFLSKTDREAISAGEIVNNASKHFPNWLQPSKEGKWNDHKKQFADTGGVIHFITPEGARGLAITYLIVDEAAFIPDMEKHWKAMFPTLSSGGSCIVISTVNGMGNWYEQEYHKAKKKKNKFNAIDLDYKEHPIYNNPEWVADQKAQLGEKGWLQEVLKSFLDSGDTYISNRILTKLKEQTDNNVPHRIKYKKWVSGKREREEDDQEQGWETEGALWIWKEPIEGREYVMGIDSADGVGDEGDNSCIEIFDITTLEQVAEFYSNVIPPHQLAQVVDALGKYYNHALAVVENNGPGGAVLSNLQYQLEYDNIWYESVSKNMKFGLKVTASNRGIIIEGLQQHCTSSTIKINSKRLVKELFTFIYHKQTRKLAATKEGHDDAIMATCFALYARDLAARDLPYGMSIPKSATEVLNSMAYEQIKREILEDSPKDMFETESEEKDIFFVAEEDINLGFTVHRKNHKLLSEFGF